MNLVGRSLALGWMTTILVVQVSVARHSRWALNAKTQALWDLSPQELECIHNFLVNRRELELQSSKVLTLAKNSVFLIEMLKPKKYEVLDFLDNGAMPPVREARVLIYFGDQEYPNVTEYAVGPVEQPMYMRKLSRKGGQELSWASRPMSKVESVLLFHTLKTATEPLQEFFFDITGFTLQDCNGGCLTFTNVAPRAMTFRKRLSWFLLQRLVNGYFLQPTGLEILVDHGSTDVQDWRVELLWYNGKFYNSPEELAQKYADGEVAIVVLEDPLPKISPQYSTYKASAEFPMPISKGGPRVLQSSAEFQIPISKGGPRVFQPSAEFQIPISKGGPRVFQPSAEFQIPISKGGPRVLQSSAESQIPISKGGPRVLQSSAEFQIPISKGGPRVLQSSAESQIPISKGGPRVFQPSAESQIPISKGGPQVFQPSAEFQIPISKGGPRVLQSSAEFQIPISKGGPRVLQSSAKSQIPISKGGPLVFQPSAESQIPISKGGPRVFQPSAESQIPISKGGPRVFQPSAESRIPISKGGPRVLQSSSEFQIPISKGGPRVFQPSAESQIPISKGGPQVFQPSAEFQIPISKGGPRVLQPSAEFQIPISKGGPRVLQSSAKSQIPISKGGPRVLQSSSEFQIPISKGGPLVFQPSAEFQIPISKGGPRVLQSSVPPYSLKHNTVIYGDWSFFFKLHSSYGLQLFNVYFGGERIAYEIGVQEVMALYRGHAAEGRETKYVDVGWGLGGITHQLTPGIDCPDTATFLDASHYYDSDGPVLYQRALCIFEVPTGVPLRRHFNSNFRNSFSSHARLNGPMLVLRTTSTIHNHDYIWDFIFHPNGVMEGKMYASDYVHAAFYTSEGLVHSTHLHSRLLGNVHSHLAHYRIDLDVAGTKNRFQTLRTRVESITSPWTRRSQQVKPILDKTQHFWERQAAFHFRQTLPKYLLFSNAGKSVLGHSRIYHLQIPSMPEQMLPPGWQSSPAFPWPRYQLAVTKYQEAERFHSSLYNQNHHWAYPMVFEDFVHNNENIKDEDLVAWVTVGLSHNLQSEDGPNMETQENSAGFLLQPFDFFQGFQRYTGTKAAAASGTRSLKRSTPCLHISATMGHTTLCGESCLAPA